MILPAGAAGVAAQMLASDIAGTRFVDAPVSDAWNARTNTEGIERFLAPKAAKVESWAGGAFGLWVGVETPEGARGSEGCRMHSVKPMEQLVFEWNAPPPIPAIRVRRTLVDLDFKQRPGNRTELTPRNYGYGDGEEWPKSGAHFARARPAVTASLEQRFAPK